MRRGRRGADALALLLLVAAGSACAATRPPLSPMSCAALGPERAQVAVWSPRALPEGARDLTVRDGEIVVGALGGAGPLVWSRAPGPLVVALDGELGMARGPAVHADAPGGERLCFQVTRSAPGRAPALAPGSCPEALRCVAP